MSDEQLNLGTDDHATTLRRAWERALHMLGNKVSKVTFESYIRPIRPLSYEDNEVALGVPSAFAREWLDRRHRSLIRATLESVLGTNVEIRFTVCPSEQRQLTLISIDDGRPAAEEPRPKPAKPATLPAGLTESPLVARYTFDSFVIGRSNRLAHAGAQAVAEAPATVYNPLFIYGGSGLGKTHLLHAVGNYIIQNNTNCRVVYVDGENFTDHYVHSLRERKTDEFRRYYRSVDVWLVDDIQSIAGKEQTKEEFFHTFNALYQTGKQIVISSDRSPKDLRTMDERLRSRFECGLIADVGAPDLETRVAIMQARCEHESWSIPDDVVYYIAGAIQSNVRALEGAITKLIAYSSIMKCPISTELAQSVLGEYFIDKPLPRHLRKGVSAEQIIEAVAGRFGTTAEAIVGQGRSREVSLARQVAMFLCRELTETPLAVIGASFGNRDHSTVKRAISKAESLMDADPALAAQVHDVRMRLER